MYVCVYNMKRNKNSNPSASNSSKQLKLSCFLKPTNREHGPTLPTEVVTATPETCVPSTSETATVNLPLQKPILQGKRKFQSSWLSLMPWLCYDEATNVAKCTVCGDFPDLSDHTSKVVKGFSGPFKAETFKKHEKSSQHMRCVATMNAKLNPAATPLARAIIKADETMINHLRVVFNCAYYIAKHNKPFSDLEELLVLTNKCGVNVLPEYRNRKACKEFVHHIASIVESDLVMDIKKSPFVSILLDGSTDISGEEQNIVYVRYLKGSDVEESFLSLVPLESASSDGYLNALQKQLQSLNLSELLTGGKLIGIGTDGASSMIGEQNGLIAKLSQFEGLSRLIGIHCIAHRLNLSVLSSVKEVKYLDQIDSAIVSLCKFYRKSPKRMRELHNVSEALECELLKPQYFHTVRWVGSKVRALTVLVKDWTCFILHLEDIAIKKGDEAAMAKGMLKKLKSFRFVLTAHFLIDFLEIFDQLSLIFQKKDILLSQVNCHVERSIYCLETLRKGNGKNEDLVISNTSLKGVFQDVQLQAIDNTAYKEDRKQMIESGIQYLKDRFTNKETDNVAQATKVFDTLSWPTGTALQDYGNEDLKILLNHFKSKLTSEGKEDEMLKTVMGEWYEFKVFGQKLPLHDLFDKAISMNDRFPLLSKLITIIAVLPTSTASCERGFSIMNLLKNKFRSSLQTDSLNHLMMINMNGPSLEDFNPQKSVEHWYFQTKGYRHVKTSQ